MFIENRKDPLKMLKKMCLVSVASIFLLGLCSSVSFAQDWKPVEGKIMSKFAKDVNPNNPHPEYPRPQLARGAWKNLNGLWDYAILGENDAQPGEFEGKILVPFPIESALSGVGKTVGAEKRLWYKRTFTVPQNKSWKGKQIRLNFGAVDWDSTVYVNGKEIGRHKGGYSPFSYDITDALTESGEQTLLVSVWDPTDDRGGTQPRGKQHNNPHGIWYTAVTGIWQTVWLEPVEKTFIKKIKAVPNLENNTIAFNVELDGTAEGDQLEVVYWTKRDVLRRGGLLRGNQLTQYRMEEKQSGPVGAPVVLEVKNPTYWTPDSPTLYDAKVSVIRDGAVLDTVETYFAMRDIKLGKDEKGLVRIMLNGKFLFQHGPLDQGWWPDGLYTAPTDKALEYDVIRTIDFGFNMLRKHVKVEPDRFYYHCDRLGVLVWQDMPSGDKYIGGNDPDAERTPESDAQFRAELAEMILTLDNHPCIVIWVPFNEGWGQYKTAEIVDYCRELDSTRLVNSASGWTDRGVGDMYDKHDYSSNPQMTPPEEVRAVVIGEYGGLGMPIKGHTWQDEKNWGYRSYSDKETLFTSYDNLNKVLHPQIAAGLSAAVYTQTTDVEIEVNGLMTYDRAVDKFDARKLKASNYALRYAPPTYETIIPTAREKASVWKWITENPGEGWEKTGFDASGWKEGESGFGTQGTPNTTVRTNWNTGDIWIRRTIELSEEAAKNPAQLALSIYHDEDCEVYINGVKVFAATGYTGNYGAQKMDAAALRKAIKAGENVIAIHCKQTTGGQFIDAGIQRIIPPKSTGVRLW